MCDRRVNDRGLGRPAYLRKIRKEGSKILKDNVRIRGILFKENKTCQESAVKSLSALPLDGIVSSPPFRSVCTATRLSLDLCDGAIGRGGGTL